MIRFDLEAIQELKKMQESLRTSRYFAIKTGLAQNTRTDKIYNQLCSFTPTQCMPNLPTKTAPCAPLPSHSSSEMFSKGISQSSKNNGYRVFQHFCSKISHEQEDEYPLNFFPEACNTFLQIMLFPLSLRTILCICFSRDPGLKQQWADVILS